MLVDQVPEVFPLPVLFKNLLGCLRLLILAALLVQFVQPFVVLFLVSLNSILSVLLNLLNVSGWVKTEWQSWDLVNPALLGTITVLAAHVLAVSVQGILEFRYPVGRKFKLGLNSLI